MLVFDEPAGDIVLLGDSATIRDAIRRGRTIFEDGLTFVADLLSANVAAVLAGTPPLLAVGWVMKHRLQARPDGPTPR